MARDIVNLKIEGTRGGPVRGESHAAGHVEEIDVQSFSWGMHSPRDAITRQGIGRVNYGDLVIFKRIDSASTALMSMLATNESVRKALLSVRRHGVDTTDYLTIALARAHVTGFELQSDGGEGRLLERLTLTYESIEVSYHGEDVAGVRKGATQFQALTAAPGE